jgi:hypothetical protein
VKHYSYSGIYVNVSGLVSIAKPWMCHCSLLCGQSRKELRGEKGHVVERRRGKQHAELHRRNSRGYRNSTVD